YISILRFHRKSRSTLIPYTTLFRSKNTRCKTSIYKIVFFEIIPANKTGLNVKLSILQFSLKLIIFLVLNCTFFGGAYTEKVGIEDRKSTRLNSSHVKISYAFFCLNK